MTTVKGLTERALKLGLTRQAVFQRDRAATGKCVDCGRKKPVKGMRIRCKACLKIRADRQRERRQPKEVA